MLTALICVFVFVFVGQTAPRQPAQTQQQQSMSTDGQSVMIHKQEIPEMDDDAQQEVIISGL